MGNAGRGPVPRRVIWITTDHMRFDCVGRYGNGEIHTPNIDSLAQSGVNFMQCFAQNPLCMPSRASFMTGMYPQQTGVTANGHCLAPDYSPSAAGVFKAAGYQAVQIGKLHFQPHDNYDLDLRPRHTYGYDVFINSEARGCYDDVWFTWLRGKYPEYVDAFRVPRVLDRTDDETKGRVIEAPWQASHSGFIAYMLRNYLETHRDSRQFIHLGFHNPHPPLNPTREAFAPYENTDISVPDVSGDEWSDKPMPLSAMFGSRKDWTPDDFREYRRYFYALVTEMDMAVGSVLTYLRDRNMLDDTLVIFTSDHGDMCANHRLTHKGPHFYDEVMHVPLILHWPDGLGRESREVGSLTELTDLLPTMLDLCAGAVPEVMSGVSYGSDLLHGREITGRESVMAFHHPDWAMVRTEGYKYIRYSSLGTEVLYDLTESHPETVNRAEDPGYAQALRQMRLMMLDRVLSASRSPQPRSFVY